MQDEQAMRQTTFIQKSEQEKATKRLRCQTSEGRMGSFSGLTLISTTDSVHVVSSTVSIFFFFFLSLLPPLSSSTSSAYCECEYELNERRFSTLVQNSATFSSSPPPVHLERKIGSHFACDASCLHSFHHFRTQRAMNCWIAWAAVLSPAS